MLSDNAVLTQPINFDLEDRLDRFRSDLRNPLRAFAQRSKAHEDLLWTFPALAIAAVTQARAAALDALRDGAPLPVLARTLGVPMWLRKLPPEALHHDLPAPAQIDGEDRAFGRKIANALPRSIEGGSVWLPSVLAARAACDDDFAVWWAQAKNGVECIEAAAAMGAYAWYSQHPRCTAASLIRRRWTPRAPAMAMAREAHDWLVRLLLDATRAHGDEIYVSRVDGYEFVELNTSAALTEEGQMMRHCVAAYGERVALGYSRIFGIRRQGARVATVEIRHINGCPRYIQQLSGPKNEPVPEDVIKAVLAWLDCMRALPPDEPPKVSAARWAQLWAPYRRAKRTMDLPAERATDILRGTRQLLALLDRS